jgi:ankyrin repeat protein
MTIRTASWLLIITLAFIRLEASSCYARPSQKSLDAALLSAVEDGNREKAKSLLAQGASVNARDENGGTPLMNASYVGDTEVGFHPLGVVKLLLTHGANVNAKDKFGGTALMTASSTDSIQAVKLLLAKGAQVNAQDKEGRTALMGAAYSEGEGEAYASPEIVKYLLAHGANANARDNDGNTSLMLATKLGSDERKNATAIVKMLLAKGANVNARTKNGNTAWKWAKMNGQTAIIQMLKRAGAKG